MKKNKPEKMTKAAYGEMAHTAFLFCNMIEAHLIESYTDEVLRKKSIKAYDALYDVFLQAKAKRLGGDGR